MDICNANWQSLTWYGYIYLSEHEALTWAVWVYIHDGNHILCNSVFAILKWAVWGWICFWWEINILNGLSHTFLDVGDRDGLSFFFASIIYLCTWYVLSESLYWVYDYLSMLGFKLIRVSKRGPWKFCLWDQNLSVRCSRWPWDFRTHDL